MAGRLGRITRATRGRRETVYLSNALGVWMEGRNLKLTNQRGEQEFHFYLSPRDGEVYYVLRALWEYGRSL